MLSLCSGSCRLAWQGSSSSWALRALKISTEAVDMGATRLLAVDLRCQFCPEISVRPTCCRSIAALLGSPNSPARNVNFRVGGCGGMTRVTFCTYGRIFPNPAAQGQLRGRRLVFPRQNRTLGLRLKSDSLSTLPVQSSQSRQLRDQTMLGLYATLVAAQAGYVLCEAAVQGSEAAPAVNTGEEEAEDRRGSITDFVVIRVPGDGRCLFHAVAHGACLRGGVQPPSVKLQCQLADELRQQAMDELQKRREETEWFIEGDFDRYVKTMRKPHVWGGEPEILMLSHVLRSPISVYIADERMPGGIIPIAEYGTEYTSKDKIPIRVLYNGSSHYDALHIPSTLKATPVAELGQI